MCVWWWGGGGGGNRMLIVTEEFYLWGIFTGIFVWMGIEDLVGWWWREVWGGWGGLMGELVKFSLLGDPLNREKSGHLPGEREGVMHLVLACMGIICNPR